MKSVLFTEVPTEWDRSDPENPVVTATESRSNFINVDTVGLVIDQPAELDSEGAVLVEATYVSGFHSNVRALDKEDASSLVSYEVNPTPATPARRWA